RRVLLAHRFRYRAAREQDLDPEGSPPLLERQLRRLEGLDRAAAREEHAPRGALVGDPERAFGRVRGALRDGDRARLERGPARRDRRAHRRAARARAADARGHLPGAASVSAVVRLVWTYFTGTRLGRWLSVAALSAWALGNIGVALAPGWTLDPTGRLDAQGAFFVFLPWPAVIAALFASALMPAMLDRMVRGRRLSVLPHGRLRLFASAIGTAGLISLATAGTAALAFYRFPIEMALGAVLVRTCAGAFTALGFTYLALWILGPVRSGAGQLAAALLVMRSVGLPLTYIDAPTAALPWPVKLGWLGWIAFGAMLLAGPRAASAAAAARRWLGAAGRRFSPRPYAEGTEESL